MKKFFIGIVLSTLVFTANAQFSFGPKVGGNFSMSTISNPNVKVDPITFGFNAGVFATDKFADQFAGKVELFYSGEGAKYKIIHAPTVYTNSIGYLNIPVLFQFVTSGGFYLETGPQLGFVLSATNTTDSSSMDIKKDVNSTKFSWCFGFGFGDTKGLGVSFRYAAGLSNINSNGDGNDKTSVLSIGLFYSLHTMGKK